MTDRGDLPEFARPPVIEVVCGVLFSELSSLLGAHIGLLWSKLRAEFDHAREVAPLAPAIEVFTEPRAVQIQLSNVPPLARTWLLTPKENGIVQIQKDRFLHNWKKVDPNDEYPRYGRVIQMFRERLSLFERFLSEHDLGVIDPRQYEMTYVNHIPEADGWSGLVDVGRVFPDIAWRFAGERFLPEAEQLNWRASFPMPEQTGRLHASVRSTTRGPDKGRILLLELTARGMPRGKSREEMWSWFDLAHEWIVRAFADLTHDDVRAKAWEQIK